MGRYGFQTNTGLMAVHTVRSVEEIARTSRPRLMQLFVRTNKIQDVLTSLSGTYGPEPSYCFPSYISSGPEIVQYRIHNFGTSDLSMPGNDRSVMQIRARSAVGLKDVQVLIGEGREGPRFDPNGKKEFEVLMNVFKDANRAYMVRVTDVRGGVAYSWVHYTEVQEGNRKRCGDNWNYMMHGKWGGTSKRNYKAHDGEASPAYGPKVYSGQPAVSGHGGLACTTNRRFAPGNFLVEGKPTGNHHPAMALWHQMIGRYGQIFTNEFLADYAVKSPVGFTIGAFGGPYKIMPTAWPTVIKTHAPMKKYDGLQVGVVEGKMTFVKDVTTTDGRPIRVAVDGVDVWAFAPNDPGEAVVDVVQASGISTTHKLADMSLSKSVEGEIPVGGYVAWYGPDGPGIGAVIALEAGIKYSFGRKHMSFFTEVPVPVKPPVEVRWRCAVINGSGLIANTTAEIEAVRVGMGLVDGRPGFYDIQPRVGAVTSQNLFLKVAGDDGGFAGKIRTRAKLPIHLPVMVSGLNRRWDAGIWYRGRVELVRADFHYDPFGRLNPYSVVPDSGVHQDPIEHIPVLDDGVGYCYVQTERVQPDFFVGNLLVCDRPEVFITVVKAARGTCTFEINNPTDRKFVCTVRPAKGFELTGRWRRKVTLSAGEFTTIHMEGNR